MDKVWLVSEILKGNVKQQDYLDDKVYYCEERKEWHYKGALTYCIMAASIRNAIKNYGTIDVAFESSLYNMTRERIKK